MADQPVDDNVDKIREILFGGTMRDYETRIAQLEQQLSKRIEKASADFDKQLERLNTLTTRELDKVSERLKAERKARLDEGKSGAREFKTLSQAMDSRFGEVEERLDIEAEELRNGLHERGQELAALIAETRDSLQAALDSETRELTDSKVSRDDLAELLTGIAAQLKKGSKARKG
ncbi:MAG: hypothetical protein HKO69_03270 [Woeseiaceae bacterium]|nr:hypothetical protein [Gammaproteobacteria bacterium]NNF48366.1 hypothetical protein [Woeseiaceae bacterium]NNK24313.1 hypothetical protein [Woeseiaceae bacterium]NNL62813.1 hypothetical protein [Woeseiaceae bacterium]